MSARRVLASLMAAMFVVLLPALAAAADAGEAITFAEIFKDGGTIGWIIVLESVIGLGLIIENFVNIRKDKLAPPDVVEEVEALFEAGDYQEAMELCESHPCFFTNVVAAGLPKLNASFEAMEKSIEEMIEEESLKLHTKIGWLTFVSASAPMLGLLGTVWGMITAFKVIAATKGQADPSQLSGGISGALITTMFGLCVAIPVTFFFNMIRGRVIKFTIEVGGVVEDLFERFRPTREAA